MSSFFEDLAEIGGNIADGVGDLVDGAADLAGDVWDSISEGVTDVFSGGQLPDFVGGLVSGRSNAATSPTQLGTNYDYQADTGDKKGWGDMFTSFVSNNQKTLLELGFGAVAGMAKASAAKDAAKAAATASSDAIAQRDQLEQDANQRFSNSITGMAPAKKMTPKPLTRMDGSRVFTPTGLINTGAK